MSAPEFSSIEIAPKSNQHSPKHRAQGRKNAIAKVAIASLVLSGIPFIAQVQNSTNPAAASNADTIGLYLSAPWVQGTDVTVAVTRESFNNVSLVSGEANCSGSFPIASITLKRSPTLVTGNTDRSVCFVRSAQDYGGATTESSTRTIGGSGSNFMAVPFYDASLSSETERSISFEFPQNVKYIGFWWSAGNPGNNVRFYDSSDNLLAELDSQEIVDVLGTNNASTATVNRVLGGTYPKGHYFGNPRGYTQQDPMTRNITSWSPNAVFAYVNLYVGGSFNAKKVQFAGPGFEFDNLAVSTVEQSPADSMVEVSQISRSNSAPPAGSGSGSGSSSAPAPVVVAPVVKSDPCTAVSSASAVSTKNRNFSGFAINSARLTPAMKKQIRTWLNRHPERVCVSVAGFTMGPRVLPTDPKLARDRARSVRAFIKSIRPEASFTPITSRTQKLVGDDVRRAKVTLRF
jgi:hypothetical protein